MLYFSLSPVCVERLAINNNKILSSSSLNKNVVKIPPCAIKTHHQNLCSHSNGGQTPTLKIFITQTKDKYNGIVKVIITRLLQEISDEIQKTSRKTDYYT